MANFGPMRTSDQAHSHAHAMLIAGGIVAAGLIAVAVAIYWRAQQGILDLGAPLQAAGAFVFAGLAFLGLAHLADVHRRIDREVSEAAARARTADYRAEAAERRYDERAKARGHTEV